MRKKICFVIILAVLCLCLLAAIIITEIYSIPGVSSICGLFLGIVLPFTFNKCVELSLNKQQWKLYERRLKKAKAINGETLVRISFAYLFRIMIDGKYLLIQSSRNTGRYQPVGGVYKYYGSEGEYLKNTYHIEPDDKIKTDSTSKNDYRFYVKDKYIKDFVKHFDMENTNREKKSDISRELLEEIFREHSISPKQFGILNYKYCSRFLDFGYTSIYQCYELVLADIYEIMLDDKQENLLRKLLTQGNEFILASKNDIENEGVKLSDGKNKETISNHSWKILPSSSEKATFNYCETYTVDLPNRK